ncbi:MAG TPA: sigma-70 family RNA polymerase sigma factor [Gemmatimonadales bacterium]|nr:sigma-70 family RNA polymerase sigma factor [Gemmatimonadales bacterium]
MSLPTPAGGVAAAPIDLERALVRRASAGDEAAFERLYRTHVARIHSLVRRMAGAESADELTQDAFVRAWNKLASFRGESAFGTWLHRVAVNVVLSRRRADRSERDWLQDGDHGLESAGARTTPAGMALDLEEAIARLPLGARQVFVLHDVEGWTHEEIAAQLGTVPGTSKSQLSRARAALRRMLDGY